MDSERGRRLTSSLTGGGLQIDLCRLLEFGPETFVDNVWNNVFLIRQRVIGEEGEQLSPEQYYRRLNTTEQIKFDEEVRREALVLISGIRDEELGGLLTRLLNLRDSVRSQIQEKRTEANCFRYQMTQTVIRPIWNAIDARRIILPGQMTRQQIIDRVADY